MISFRKYNKAKKVIEDYEKQQNSNVVDIYLTEYQTLVEAIGRMSDLCYNVQRTVYCYQKSNNKYVVLFSEIPNANPVYVLKNY